MEPQVLVSLASTSVAAIAVIASLVTTQLSLRTQRANTAATLATQERLAAMQERALRERSHEQDLRDKRAAPYLALLKWAERVLAELSELDEHSKPYLSVSVWNINDEMDGLLDLYASDTIHVRYAALRGQLMGLVNDASEGLICTKIVTWSESDGAIDDVRIADGPVLNDWHERIRVCKNLVGDAIKLIAQIRAELQDQKNRGYYIIWRLSPLDQARV